MTGGDPQEPNDHDEPMTEADVRELLANVHTDKLDAFRAGLPTMRTSELISVLAGTEPMVERLLEHLGLAKLDLIKEPEQMIVLAASLAASDELDARIPPRDVPERCPDPECRAPINVHPLADSCTNCSWVRVKVGGR